jgi:Tfp pilus assembly protein PilV
MRSLRARILSEESGSTLIEVLVSAVLVAMLAVGVLKGLDAANASSGNNKARGVAADLAQQDQERLRGYRAKELSNAHETNTRTVAGVDYTVSSDTEWVTDSSGTQSCTSSSAQADYIKITSTVTWPQMFGAKPVSVRSLFAPPNGSFGNEGSLGVQVVDRNGNGVAGVDVSATGPKTVGGTTDSAGCVFFGHLTAGNYQASFTKPGFVDANGVNQVVRSVGVQDDATQIVTIDYDASGGMQVSVDTKKGAAAAVQPADTPYVSVGHSSLAAPGARVFGNGTPASSYAVTGLFPFTGAYSVYTGNCVGANPSIYGGTPGVVTVTPGGNPAVTIREPAMQVRRYLIGNGGPTTTLATGARVRLTAQATGCGGTTAFTTDASGWLKPNPATPNNDPGVPYGIYDVCAVEGGKERKVSSFTLDDKNGETVTVPILAGDPTGTCP